MSTDKIVFVTLPRSGSTYMCKVVKRCFAAKKVDFISVNPEISNIDQWVTNSQHIVEENAAVISQLNLDLNSIDSNFVNRMVLHYLTQSKPFVLKYFPFDSLDFSVDELIAVSKRHNVRLIVLYRKNILDTFVSRVVKYNFGDLNQKNKNLLLKSNLKFDQKILEYDILESHQIYYNIYKKLKASATLERVIAYEDLSFIPSIDSALIYDNLEIKGAAPLTKKLVTDDVMQYVLGQMPFLKTDLVNLLKHTDIPITDDFCFSLDE